MPDLLQVVTTLPGREDAERIAQTLVKERLAACAQISGPISSHYWWQDRMEQATEWCCCLKTTERQYAALEARLQAIHPYEVPEILAFPVSRSGDSYAAWVRAAVRSPAQ